MKNKKYCFIVILHLENVNKINMSDNKKQELIDGGRLMQNHGLVVASWGNMSFRGDNGNIIIKPSGVDYSQMTTEDLIEIDSNGNVVDSSNKREPSSEWRMHVAIYKNRPEIRSIFHVHSPFATSLAVAQKNLPACLEDVVQIIGGEVRVTDYKMTGTQDFADEVVDKLHDRMAALLANHGMVACGRDIQEAIHAVLVVEKAAQIFIQASSLGPSHSLSVKDVAKMREFYLSKYYQPKG